MMSRIRMHAGKRTEQETANEMHRKSADNNRDEATPQGSGGQAEALTVQ